MEKDTLTELALRNRIKKAQRDKWQANRSGGGGAASLVVDDERNERGEKGRFLDPASLAKRKRLDETRARVAFRMRNRLGELLFSILYSKNGPIF